MNKLECLRKIFQLWARYYIFAWTFLLIYSRMALYWERKELGKSIHWDYLTTGVVIYIVLTGGKEGILLLFYISAFFYSILQSWLYAQKNCGSDKTDVTSMLWEGLGKQSGRLPARSDNWDSALMWVCKAHCSRQHTYVCRRENRVQRLSLHCLHRTRTTCQ